MKYFFLAPFLLATSCIWASPKTPEQAFNSLIEGNKRFLEGKCSHPSHAAEARSDLVEKQIPFAAIIGCSDSRVPPEIIFDQGLGDLFVVRDAGNVIGPIETDSVEFAAMKLEVPLIVVLGHQNCGAIKACLNGKDAVPELDQIFPYIDAAFHRCGKEHPLQLKEAIYCNIKNGVETLAKSPTIAPLIQSKKIKVIGAYFEIETGKVIFL
ncbi:MAG: carbonic anhydrase [Chlamydiota bacterium]|jgi:carbonic anhydrase